MEKVVSRRKRVRVFLKRGNLYVQNPQSIFREHDNGHLSNIQNAENITSAVIHGMHGIHFLTTKRFVRKRFVSLHQQDVSLYPQTEPSSPRQTIGEIRL